jgi:hypothetical protein
MQNEYPRAMFRKPTEAEIAKRRADVPEERWLDRKFDLILLTSHNYPKTAAAWESFCTRPFEQIAQNESEQKKLQAEGWTKHYADTR